MSTALALASVTAVLKDLLNNGLIDHDVHQIVNGDVTISSLPPDRAETSTGPSFLNLFLYNVTPNAAWRNRELPSRDTRGDRISNPPLALDLHYLLSAYGQAELDAEILLGYGMQLLHETPVLTRDAIRRTIAPPSFIASNTDIPDPLRELATSELADQFEQLRITPDTMSRDDISKLWTAFGAKYRPSAAYLVSVVLIEAKLSARTPLPVKTRNLYVRTFKQPVITALKEEPFLVEQDLVIKGEQLEGETTVVRIGTEELAPASVSAKEISLKLPLTLTAGIQPVQVIHRINMGFNDLPHTGVESNVMPFVLRPRIDDVDIDDVSGAGSDPRSATITVMVAPEVLPTQRARLLLNEIQAIASVPSEKPPAAYSFLRPNPFVLESVPATPPTPTNVLVFPVKGITAGKYLVRVQIDGAESVPVIGGGGVYDDPQVDVP